MPSAIFKFYKQAALVAAIALAITLASILVCIKLSLIKLELVPLEESEVPMVITTDSDKGYDGTSSISLKKESSPILHFKYRLTKDAKFPFVSVSINFIDAVVPKSFLDLSRYSVAKLYLKCSPGNILSFHLLSFDPENSKLGDFTSYRLSERLVPCESSWSQFEIKLRKMEVPYWWSNGHAFELSDQRYWLENVVAISFVAARQGPVNMPADVKIKAFSLQGRDWRYIYLFGFVEALVFAGCVIFLLKAYTQYLVSDAQEKIQRDLPLIAFQQLSIAPSHECDKSAVARFLATAYANPDINLDLAEKELGMPRDKINEILKDELGFSLSAYVNKLRLSEAARLLSENKQASINEIAYLTGYKNVTYFNTLFKAEYGCSPKKFTAICQQTGNNHAQ